MSEQSLLEQAYRAFDAANSSDPNSIIVNGQPRPKEVVFAERMSLMLEEIEPDASMALKLAVRCQHLCRWEVPRSTQPLGRAGYLKWREGLKKYHADKAESILRGLDAPAEIVARVHELNLKRNIKTDPECQTLEDVLCLVFLQYQFDQLIADTEEEKIVRIVKKTWVKMSPRGQDKAMQLDYSQQAAHVLKLAI